jgi:hypothetical protein
MLTSKELIFKYILLFLLAFGAIYQFKYRFNHPEMTETQLLFHFFDAFKE